ncbi:MAG: hypothetical protein IPL42_01160 [Saprospiraceae bacterium]|nr:hypothetical protein [Saprospiraceae bacterium]
MIDIENGHRHIQTGSNSQKEYSPGTVKNYKGFLSQWIAFESKKQPKKYQWDDLNRNLYNQFLQFLYKREYSANAAGRHIKNWKVIAQAAFDDKSMNKAFRDQYFKTITSKVDNIYLNEEEVQKLEKLNLSNRPAWEKARDLFLMECYTALRFSDIKKYES